MMVVYIGKPLEERISINQRIVEKQRNIKRSDGTKELF